MNPAASSIPASANPGASPALSPLTNPHLIGLEAPVHQLQQALTAGRLAGSWLLTGEAGVGKATLALRLARYLLAGSLGAPQPGQDVFANHSPAADSVQDLGLFGDLLASPAPELFPASTPDPAPQAVSQQAAVPDLKTETAFALAADHPVFQQVANLSHPDCCVVMPEATGQSGRLTITIEQIRRLTDFLRLAAGHDGWRVALVDQAHSMTRQAQNALLKSLEEPPAQTLILLTTPLPSALLPTIRSRCRRLSIPALSGDQVRQGLALLYPDYPPLPTDLQASFRLTTIGQAARFLVTLWPGYQSLLELLGRSGEPNFHLLQQWRKSLSPLTSGSTLPLESELMSLLMQRWLRSFALLNADQSAAATPTAPLLAQEAALFSRLSLGNGGQASISGHALGQRQAAVTRWLQEGAASNLDPAAISWQALTLIYGLNPANQAA
jgi:DNA polymerase-3 subunit delta'